MVQLSSSRTNLSKPKHDIVDDDWVLRGGEMNESKRKENAILDSSHLIRNSPTSQQVGGEEKLTQIKIRVCNFLELEVELIDK